MPDVNFIQQEKKEKEKKDGKSHAPQESPVSGVNLMTQETRDQAFRDSLKRSVKRLFFALLFSFGCAVAIFVTMKIYGFIVTQQLRELVSTRGTVESKIGELEKNSKALLAFQNKLSAVKSLFENHFYWSKFFAEFEKNVFPSVSFDGISVTAGNSITMSGTAPDYQTVGRQLLAFQKATNVMSSVRITSGDAVVNQTGDVVGVGFEVSFSINPDILKKK